MTRTPHQPDSAACAVDSAVADHLRGAASYLAAHGWTQGDYYHGDYIIRFPPACVEGAIAMAVHGHRTCDPFSAIHPARLDLDDAVDVLDDFLTATCSRIHQDKDDSVPILLPEWNDRPDMTVERVIAALHAAADDYDKSHASGDDRAPTARPD